MSSSVVVVFGLVVLALTGVIALLVRELSSRPPAPTRAPGSSRAPVPPRASMPPTTPGWHTTTSYGAVPYVPAPPPPPPPPPPVVPAPVRWPPRVNCYGELEEP